LPQAAVREVREEAGVECEVSGLIVRQGFSICFRAKLLAGELRASSEITEVRWVDPERCATLNIHPSTELRLDHALEFRAQSFYT
jgi:8-oxo-dGTP pyrophosphatase MutT (NUDIX family)